jgi:protocatechuate 3,4-dioxygenase beta subunit
VVTVTSEDSTPLPASSVEVTRDLDKIAGEVVGPGEFAFQLPAAPAPLAVTVVAHAPGHVTTRVLWNGMRRKLDLPTRYQVKLPQAITIGGMIEDAMGQPISEARMDFRLVEQVSPPDAHPLVYNYLFCRRLVTGADGTWSMGGLPANLDDLMITVDHPGFVERRFFVGKKELASDELAAGKARIDLSPGIVVAGRVIRPDGAPAANASVRIDARSVGEAPSAKTTTDSEGRFHFATVSPGPVVLTATAADFGPAFRTLTLLESDASIELVLTMPQVIEGVILDAEGHPIPGAHLSSRLWQNASTLDVAFRANDEGQFQWKEAPLEPVTFRIQAPGYKPIRDEILTPGKPATLRLDKQVSIWGHVRSASDGAIIHAFDARVGIPNASGGPTRWLKDPKSGQNHGFFRFTLPSPPPQVIVEVKARGFEPFLSDPLPTTDPFVQVNMSLVPSAAPPAKAEVPSKAPPKPKAKTKPGTKPIRRRS